MTDGQKRAKDLYETWREALIHDDDGPTAAAVPKWEQLSKPVQNAWYCAWLHAEDMCINDFRSGRLK